MRRAVAALALAGSLSAWPMAAAADCPLDLGRGTGWVVYSDRTMVAFRPEPMRIEVGQPFSLLFNVCTRKDNPAELLAVDAHMPEHRHGMNYRPAIVSAGKGRFRADGLVFHMPGRWELDIDVRAGSETERLNHEIIVK
ncbi:MAG: hypothetical protein AB7U95_28995 [Reyranella sp.]